MLLALLLILGVYVVGIILLDIAFKYFEIDTKYSTDTLEFLVPRILWPVTIISFCIYQLVQLVDYIGTKVVKCLKGKEKN